MECKMRRLMNLFEDSFRSTFFWNLLAFALYFTNALPSKCDTKGVTVEGTNLYCYGPNITTDKKLVDRAAQIGHQIDLLTYFPYYGARYNYSIISVNGYITFGNLLDDGLNYVMGSQVEHWPEEPDPATIAVYACKQKEISTIHSDHRGVHYRVVFRSDTARSILPSRLKDYADRNGDRFLETLENDLKEGMVGAQNFKAAAALVVTWENITFLQASRDDQKNKRATYQAVLMTDAASQLSYVILNYHSLGYSGADISGQMKRWRCQALFNGGNHTGSVNVDPLHSKNPTSLAAMSAIPHKVGGRYVFRVDDIVKRGGCSNVTSGTFRMTIYPDQVNAMGDTNIQLNGPCIAMNDEPILQISEYTPAVCRRKNQAIAICKMVRHYHWGTKNVYLKLGQNRAYVGSIYYVPPGLDPFQLDIGDPSKWFSRERPMEHQIKWRGPNFTDKDGKELSPNSLKLSLWGYKERMDEETEKFVPILEKVATLNLDINPRVNLDPQSNKEDKTDEISSTLKGVTTGTKPNWVDNGERNFWTYRFGFLRLSAEDATQPDKEGGGLWSPPISLHFWWGDDKAVKRMSAKNCLEWYNADGHQWNFIRDTETNSSCPCRLDQAILDIGRYMPHPKCSDRMRNLGCDVYIGAKECFLSAQNIQGQYVTHYGQVCCYDNNGYLMQTSYQSVVQVENYPYSPGFPQRAYEFGTAPFTKQFEIPTLSNYYHDVMPYFFCCKWTSDHCQFFYWRRPSSGCQNYVPPGVAAVMGHGHFLTFNNQNYTFNLPGTYVLLHKPEINLHNNPHRTVPHTPEVLIEIRLERFPNRMVDFSHGDTAQADLVQPLNVTVVTGVAIQEGSIKEADRVVFTLRKDNRRSRYRLNVLVNDELRYFDTVQRQKYRGVLIYVNNVREGQSEIYAALDTSRIGIRVRESYGVEIVKNLNFEESFGLLDVMVSVPPEYMMRPHQNNEINWLIAMGGLAGTFTHQSDNRCLDPETRQPITVDFYKASFWAKKWAANNVKFQDLFALLYQEHDTWPEAALLTEVYQVAPKWALNPSQIAEIEKESDSGRGRSGLEAYDNADHNCKHPPSGANTDHCPDPSTMADIERECREMHQCKHDYFFTKQSELGSHIRQEWRLYREGRTAGTKHYNSCGAINIEYPEYLMIDPPSGKLYLEGDTVHFDCYQDHWIKGQSLFKCMQDGWTKGSQPWCRSRKLEQTQKILAIVFGIAFFILALLAVFLCCHCIRQQRGEKIIITEPVVIPKPKVILEPEPQKPSPPLLRSSPPLIRPSPRKVSISGADTLPLMTEALEKEWDEVKELKAKKSLVDSFGSSTKSSPAVRERPKHIVNTYTPPLGNSDAKRTWV